MNNKKAISAVVATVLIILITVAAVTILWASIIPMITNKLSAGTICLDAVSQVSLIDSGYTCRNPNNISIQIKHGAKDINLKDIQILMSEGGNTVSYSLINSTTTIVPSAMTSSKLPGPNEEKTYIISTVGIAGNVSKVAIAPVVIKGKMQRTCSTSSFRVLRDC